MGVEPRSQIQTSPPIPPSPQRAPQVAVGGLITFIPSQVTLSLPSYAAPTCTTNCSTILASASCSCPAVAGVTSTCWPLKTSTTSGGSSTYTCCTTTCTAKGFPSGIFTSASFSATVKALSSAAGLSANITFVLSSSAKNYYTGLGNEVAFGRVFTGSSLRYAVNPYTGAKVTRTVFTYCAAGNYPGTSTAVLTSSTVSASVSGVSGAAASPPPPPPPANSSTSTETARYYASCIACPK